MGCNRRDDQDQAREGCESCNAQLFESTHEREYLPEWCPDWLELITRRAGEVGTPSRNGARTLTPNVYLGNPDSGTGRSPATGKLTPRAIQMAPYDGRLQVPGIRVRAWRSVPPSHAQGAAPAPEARPAARRATGWMRRRASPSGRS